MLDPNGSKDWSDEDVVERWMRARNKPLRPKAHADTFEHNGHDIHVVVSPNDCAACHSSEAEQYAKNLMSHAYDNLDANQVYHQLQLSINGRKTFKDGKIKFEPADDETKAETCYYCHGTKLKITGTEIRDTELAGELEFPIKVSAG